MKKINNIKNKFKYIYFSTCAFITLSLLNINPSLAGNKVGGTGGKFITAFNELSDFAKTLTNGMLAVSMLSGIAVILYHAVQLALVGSNPNERSKVLKNLFTCMICMALLGSIGLVMSFIMFYVGI